jgi:hypothetical protein
MSVRFRRVAEGIEVSLEPGEVGFLADVLGVLAGLGDPEDDPGAARLSPPVYLDDPEADEEWQHFAGGELVGARRTDRSSFELVLQSASEGPTVMSVGEAAAFVRVVNEARLVLGARWGIEGPDDYEDLRPEAANALAYLGWVVAELAELLSVDFESPSDLE